MLTTIKDVAKEAGLAVGTVSNYLNGKASVKPQNRERIEKAVAALGFEVNEYARNLKKNSSQTIGVIIPSFRNIFAVRTVSCLETIFRNKNFSLQVSSYNDDMTTLGRLVNSMAGKHVEGVVVMPSNAMNNGESKKVNMLIDRNIPVVFFDSKDVGIKCDHVTLNNYETFREVTGRLLAAGHEKIAIFLGPDNISSSKERLQAYVNAHQDTGVSVIKDYVIHTDYSKSESKMLCDQLLAAHPEVSAILSAGNRITLGILSAINGKGLLIPDDISVMGFDISDISDLLNYNLAVINIPAEKVAEAIAEILLKKIKNPTDKQNRKIEIKLELTAGNSIKRNEGANIEGTF